MYEIVIDYSPTEADNAILKEGIIAFNASKLGERDQAFSVFLKNNQSQILGGVQALLGTDSVYIDVLWIEKAFRNQGYGTKLLKSVEQEASKNGCQFSLVDTWDFQAEKFYLKNDYERIAEIKNYWLGHAKIFLRKKLNKYELTKTIL